MEKIKQEDFDWCTNCQLIDKYNHLLDLYNQALKNYDEQLKINDEHQKINGKLREEDKKIKENIDKAIEILNSRSHTNNISLNMLNNLNAMDKVIEILKGDE